MVSHEKLSKEDFTLNDLKNSETVKNLMRAFAGESQARNRYTFAASQAKKEGLPVIQAVFSYTAGQEKEHAEIFYNYLKDLKGETIFIDGGYPVDLYDQTVDSVSYTHLDVYKRQGFPIQMSVSLQSHPQYDG